MKVAYTAGQKQLAVSALHAFTATLLDLGLTPKQIIHAFRPEMIKEAVRIVEKEKK